MMVTPLVEGIEQEQASLEKVSFLKVGLMKKLCTSFPI
uniref:Uncharacterized protein n=2 Tax=Enterobacteriaceae TaxID=543 RepID=A0A6H0A664_ECOLX|nr:hypothetical protein [Klebsiella pneumoniae]QIS35229.1 hypothetical protein [Escherichia coli]